ncbi:short-chain dehydrogenase/reductase SDR [Leptotrichia hofstadii]|uniref:Short-chain dehydrogenase/reductase SDR n=1 Tax=Leptotrichia hofstadii TaxID=157688 RepID=A0A510JID6_9FUSO|nr:SDR family oxidoreductase [Leptotrichia hofstadii]BBM38151.1 short-chain dehydrogenase/reductase SDR [Leptotrichia hofstadii]
MFDLAGEVALVTGGSKGIGKGIAKALKQARAKIIIGDIDKEKGKETANELDGEFYYLDVTDKEQVEYVVQSIYEKYGKLSILCSNAGIFPQVSIENMTEKDWDKVQDINVKGTFFVSQAVLKYMKKQSYGRVILTSSITGPITGLSGWAHYGASKSAQLGFMRSAAIEYAKYGITVNAIQPGNVISDGLLSMENSKSYMNQIKEIIPVYTLGKPEDIGYTAVFLASREAGFITGQTIVVDGGQVLLETLTFI